MALNYVTNSMNLTLPTPSQQIGPVWASELNAAIELIDSHDHTSGKGVKVPSAGININANLDFNSFSLLNAFRVSLAAQGSTPSGVGFLNSITSYQGNLYYTNASGVAVQLTNGGAVASSPGNVQSYERFNVSSDLSISAVSTYVFLSVDTSVAREITLPLASSVADGRIYIIKDATGDSEVNAITITASGSDVIDGQASQLLQTEYGSWTIVADGSSNWYIS